MFSAIAENGVEIPASKSLKGLEYFCLDCKERVLCKQGKINQWHFAHYADNPDCLRDREGGTGESDRHIAMKKWAITFGERTGGIARDEVTNTVGGNKHRADVVIEYQDGRKFVVECQVSPISAGDWRVRTFDWRSAGYGVLWLWDHDKVDHEGLRESVWTCHEEARGRFYSLNTGNQLMSNHIWWGEVKGNRYVKFIDNYPLPEPLFLYSSQGQGLTAVNFQEGDFWVKYERLRQEKREQERLAQERLVQYHLAQERERARLAEENQRLKKEHYERLDRVFGDRQIENEGRIGGTKREQDSRAKRQKERRKLDEWNKLMGK